jgi:tyrosyl-tRNA synthetase
MLTFLPLEEIDAMSDWEGSQLNEAKDILAYELTKLVHGEEEAEKAREASKALFGGGMDSANMPTTTLADEDFTDGKIDILAVLVKAGLNPSRSEARRAVDQGGVTVDGEKCTDNRASFTKEDLKDGKVFRRGKKAFMKVLAE